MIKKQASRSYFIFLLLTTPTILESFWNSPHTQENKNILEESLKKCSGVDKKISKLLLEKNNLLEKIKNNPEIKNFWEIIKNNGAALQESELCQQITYHKECLTLLNALESYNQSVLQPKLLRNLDLLLPIIRHKEYDQFASLLLQQRIHLLEMSDEFLTVRSLHKQIMSIKETLEQELIHLKKQFFISEEYLNITKEHQTYLQHPLILELKKLYSDLWNLYLEKESKLLKQKEYQCYLYDIKKEAQEGPLLYNCNNELEKIIIEQSSFFELKV